MKVIVKRTVVIFSLLVIFLPIAIASSPASLKFDMVVDVGMSFPSNAQLDNFLETQGYCKLPKDDGFSNLAIGFRIHDTTSHVMLEFLYSKNELNSSDNNSKINSHGYQLNLLYNLRKNSNWIIAPRLSLAYSDYNLTALSTNINSNLSGLKLEEGFALKDAFDLQIGPTVERRFEILSIPFNIGLNVFYNIQLGKHNWENQNGDRNKIIPPFNTNAFGCIVRVGIGLN